MNNLAAVQTAVYAALTASPATYPVYDAVPQSVAKPYIVIADIDSQQDEQVNGETSDTAIHLDTWSTYAGKSQTHAMIEFIRARLHGQTISGTWAMTEEMNEILEDSGSTATARLFHGVTRYRARVG